MVPHTYGRIHYKYSIVKEGDRYVLSDRNVPKMTMGYMTVAYPEMGYYHKGAEVKKILPDNVQLVYLGSAIGELVADDIS